MIEVDNEKIKLKFSVEYFVKEDSEMKCQARVKIEIPFRGKGEALPRILRDAHTTVFKETLNEYWGLKNYEKRVTTAEKVVKATSWDELKQKVEQLIDRTIETLEKVKEKNLALYETRPPREEREFVI